MACASCGELRPVMLAMEPHQGVPWEVCSKCYPTMTVGNFKHADEDEPRPKKGDKMGKSLITGDQYVATGEVIRSPARERRSVAKDEAGSFESHPNAPEEKRAGPFTGGVQYVPDEDGYW